MSLGGLGVGDIITLTTLAWNAFQNSRKASSAHHEISQELESLYMILHNLEKEAHLPNTLLSDKNNRAWKDLKTVLSGCDDMLEGIDESLSKYNGLSKETTSGSKKFMMKVKYGNGDMKDIPETRQKITSYTSSITALLNVLSVSSLGDVRNDTKDILKELRAYAALHPQEHVRDDKSALTSYGDDDKAIWKEFRRKAIKNGYSSGTLDKNMPALLAFMEKSDRKNATKVRKPHEDRNLVSTGQARRKASKNTAYDGKYTRFSTGSSDSDSEQSLKQSSPPIKERGRRTATSSPKPQIHDNIINYGYHPSRSRTPRSPRPAPTSSDNDSTLTVANGRFGVESNFNSGFRDVGGWLSDCQQKTQPSSLPASKKTTHKMKEWEEFSRVNEARKIKSSAESKRRNMQREESSSPPQCSRHESYDHPDHAKHESRGKSSHKGTAIDHDSSPYNPYKGKDSEYGSSDKDTTDTDLDTSLDDSEDDSDDSSDYDSDDERRFSIIFKPFKKCKENVSRRVRRRKWEKYGARDAFGMGMI
ncbi:uncharacterized protein EAE98_010035 [Botrytis deweyae]|uniref:Fungal N-terminal domain-containing protein n=1 Tax=Botrytis deweyae TaxID=2478750 RepID=A0ABQ7I9L6_9HELO|nr:uncharacterized protein EAE98_010035 [Botrytis deweyae]KAF7917619.1 hypothetical protein EAE98_010035 [Botrytis deweyae]